MTFPAFQGHTRYPRWEAVPYAFFPKSPYHRQAPQILHILQSWKLCRPGETCSLHPVLEEEGKTKELKKCGRHHLSSKTCSPFSIVTFKQTWSIISKLNFLGRERYIFFFRLIMFADFSIIVLHGFNASEIVLFSAIAVQSIPWRNVTQL